MRKYKFGLTVQSSADRLLAVGEALSSVCVWGNSAVSTWCSLKPTTGEKPSPYLSIVVNTLTHTANNMYKILGRQVHNAVQKKKETRLCFSFVLLVMKCMMKSSLE